jgi:hypothetical protein
MNRVFLVVLGLGIVALGAGVAFLGMFPPPPPVKPIEKTLSNERFQSR